ncbi:dnaJ homolog subfamily B member 14-like [Anopheles maculipalpis]|uniref:dnaJ homolog subfamily B member 14-like n=1 Tax=Anopheles maculipalpis TaxID=1496333 RepID=UPI002159B086|nr:dnaJ homolog subfamily B member 14-like [Anopheles maculipalpis]
MEVNKDEAKRCIEMATAALKMGNLEKAERLLKKSQSLYPLAQAEELLKRVKAAGSKPSSGNSTSGTASGGTANGAASARRRPVNREGEKPAEPKLNIDYTQEQANAVKRVQKCKDFYEVLGVSQEATDSEIKKCYKKHALQLHPDKNKAPGAMEAFKSLGNAVETLTDPQKRKAYDLYRTTGGSGGFGGSPGTRTRTPNGGYTYGQNGFNFQTAFDEGINTNDLFNMFFGGGFPQQQQQHQQHHYYRTRTGRTSQYDDRNVSQPSLIFQLILCFIVVSLLSTFFASDPVYSLQQTGKFSVERRTLNLKIPYYVKNNFLNEYQGTLGRLEHSVEEEYVTYMKRACSNERTYRDAMIGRAKSFGSRAQYQQAQQLKVPSCDALYRLNIGVVQY